MNNKTIVTEKRGLLTVSNVSKFGLGATLSAGLLANAHALDPAAVTAATKGNTSAESIDIAALFVLGIVMVIFSAKKIIGFFSR